MATATPHPSAVGTDKQEIVIVSHSTLFYWWPVWALGFVFFLLSFFGPTRMALVPPDTRAVRQAVAEVEGKRDALVVPKDASLPSDPVTGQPVDPHVRMAPSKGYGVVFMVLLFFVVLITNVPLRGMWSLMVLVVLFLGTVILWLAGWWESILHSLSLLQIYINAGGYLTIAVLLFGLWLVTFIFFDRQVYMVFTPGQLKVCQEIGGGEMTFPTSGIKFQKQRSDLFRHWILGLGSGDLIVKTAGASQEHFEMHNVLFIGYKVKQIEDMLRDVPIVRG
jgi:hypothetical protein